ncbi:hypothetical protein IWX58_003553 [Rubrivivax gelatinosus]|uniref:hypothetical protein n=2 Tax=Rubrivivax gelatinosus TaxID=28068 RepID=UPI0018CBD069|nr:hypothetical protein [Rubrivivax gelatinosus]MBG6081866.1 hypothetical protein [Rubrivivax gelatinosus]
MQVQNTIPGAQPTRGARRDEAGAATAARGAATSASGDSTPAAAPAAAEREAAPLRAARQREQGLSNRTVAGAQRTLNYLDELQQRLKVLQERLSRRVADGASKAATDGAQDDLQDALAAAAEAWQARRDETSGFLDDALRFDADGRSRVRFRMRGLSSAALDGGRAETLSFQTRSARRTLSVVLPEGGDAESAVRQLDRTLAPAGVRASMDAGGEPVFSVAEEQWATLQTSLSVSGGGIRYPAGQSQPVRLQRQKEALDPAQWGVADSEQARRTLREVSQALERVQRVAESLRRLLASEASATAQDGAWASQFAGDLNLALNSASYETYVAIAPALGGISRSRVVELLSLG